MLESVRGWCESESETYIGVVEHEGGGGIDGNGACVCGRVRFLTGMDLESIELRSLVVVVRRHVSLQVGSWEGRIEGMVEGQLRVFKEGRKPLKSNRAIARHRPGRDTRARDMHAHRHMIAGDAIRCGYNTSALGGKW